MLRRFAQILSPSRRVRASVADLAQKPWGMRSGRVDAFLADLCATTEALSGAGMFGHRGIESKDPLAYEVHERTAVIPIEGVMMPEVPWYFDWFGISATSTLVVREQIARAEQDRSVDDILLVIDSPGGLAQGTADLADDVWECEKLVRAFAVGQVSSAAYYVASQAKSLGLSRDAVGGSIGVIMRAYDYSKHYEDMGLRPAAIRSSPLKGGPMRGEELNEANQAPDQEIVDDLFSQFRAAVQRGRGLTDEQFEALGDPGVEWSASKLVELGLADRIETLDVALASAAQDDPPDDAGDDDEPPPASGAEELAMTKTNEQMKAELDAERAKLEADRAQLAAEKEAIAKERAKANADKMNAEAAVAAAKDELIAKAVAAGRINAVNKAAIKVYAETVSTDELEKYLAAMPVLTRPAPQGVTGNQTDDGVDRDDLKQIADRFGVSMRKLQGATGNAKVFDFAAFAREAEENGDAAGGVQIIGA